MNDFIVGTAILVSVIYLVRIARKKTGCGGGCDCVAKDLKKTDSKR